MTEADHRERRRIARNTRASLMSDTKWRKLFRALDRADLRLGRCVFKFVGEPDERVASRPGEASLYPPRPWIDASLGPIRLRTIEWLLFPRTVEHRPHGDRTIPARRFEQDVDAAARIITELGSFPIEVTEEGLRIRGHLTSLSADPMPGRVRKRT